MRKGRSKFQGLFTGLSAALVCSLALIGCATSSSRGGGEGKITQLESDPILIRASRDGEQIYTEHLDAEEVFQQAFHAYQGRRYEEAMERYEIILEYFQESRFHLAALYNAGLTLEQLEQWRQAVEVYGELLERYPDSDQAMNARFRLANGLHELQEYEEAAQFLMSVLLRSDLSHFDRVEAHIRRGQALLEIEEWRDARNSFENVLELNRRASARDRLEEKSHLMVLAHFGRGRAYHGEMNEIPLVLPPSRMVEDLERKADAHQAAQGAYIRALRQHHPRWSVAAGYMIGRLYQDFYMDIFTAEIPDDLTELELSVYFEELRDKTRVLMDRALNVYERNLALSRRLAQTPEAEEWVEATALHLSRMRAFLDDPMVQERAEELVINGGDLDELWDVPYYARRHVGDALKEAVEAAHRSKKVSPELASESGR